MLNASPTNIETTELPEAPDMEGMVCALSRKSFATTIMAEAVCRNLASWAKICPEVEDLRAEMKLELETLFAYIDDIKDDAQELREAFYVDHELRQQKRKDEEEKQRAPLAYDVRAMKFPHRRGIGCHFNDAGDFCVHWRETDGSETVDTYRLVAPEQAAA